MTSRGIRPDAGLAVVVQRLLRSDGQWLLFGSDAINPAPSGFYLTKTIPLPGRGAVSVLALQQRLPRIKAQEF